MKEELLIPLIGGIAAALIAALVSLVVVILSKDQKTSEFRQAWIDGLRDDTSKFVGTARTVVGVLEIFDGRKTTDTEVNDFFLSKFNEMVESEFLLSKIKLRLNPDEHGKIIDAIEWFRDGKEPATSDEISQKVDEFVRDIQLVLKEEWERVKAGEKSFRILKYSSGGVVVSIVFAMIGYLFSSNMADFLK